MDIVIANKSHSKYATIISDIITDSAKVRRTGIAKRTPDYIIAKLENQNAVIALDGNVFAGFCYIEAWDHDKFVANSGLVVHPDYRKQGLAKKIKKVIFDYSKEKFPDAKIFGITTGLAVLKINYELGYRPVTFSELTNDKAFWKGCQTCKNYDVLMRTNQRMCLCTGMLYDPRQGGNLKENTAHEHPYNKKVLQRLKSIKQALFLKNKKNE